LGEARKEGRKALAVYKKTLVKASTKGKGRTTKLLKARKNIGREMKRRRLACSVGKTMAGRGGPGVQGKREEKKEEKKKITKKKRKIKKKKEKKKKGGNICR